MATRVVDSVSVRRLRKDRAAIAPRGHPRCIGSHRMSIGRSGSPNREARQWVTMRSLAFLFVAILGLAAFEGCGSDSPTAKTTAGTCNPVMCPVPQTGKQCCNGNACGVDLGNGCMPY